VGVEEVFELSLVSRGAAKNSKIIAPSDAKLGQEAQRLAAAGVELGNYYCTASASDEGVEEVNFESFMTQLNTVNGEKQNLAVELSDVKSKLSAEEQKVSDLNSQIATLTEERDALQTQINEADSDEGMTEEQTTALNAYIGKQYVALKTLDGDTDAKALDNVAEMVDFIDKNEARLSALIPAGGASTAASGGQSEEDLAKAKDEARLKASADAYRSKN
jgi:chromosome segregation ATPase